MSIKKFNDTDKGRQLLDEVHQLQSRINEICSDVYRLSGEKEPGYCDWDDDGFFLNTDI